MSRFSILTVDDESTVLELLYQTLHLDYDVLRASNGLEALELLGTRPVDLIITDQRMPGMRGTELLERARSLAPGVPAILLTAYTDPPDLIDALNSRQVFRFIKKPWDIDDLIQTVRSALEGVALRRENRRLQEDSERRLRALELIHGVGRVAATSRNVSDFVDSLSRGIAEIVPVDVVATLVRAEPGTSHLLSLRCSNPVPEPALEVLQEALCVSFSELSGVSLSLEEAVVRVNGRTARRTEAARLGAMRVFRLETGSSSYGLLAIGTNAPEGIDPADERVVEIISTHAGEVLSALHAGVESERRRAQTVIDHVRDGLAVTSPHGEVLFCNDAVRDLLGVRGAPLDGDQLFHLLGTEPFALFRQVELAGSQPFRDRIDTAGGPLNLEVTPVFDAERRLDCLVFRFEARVERSDALLSFVSNELRTPLTSVRGNLELLLEGSLGSLRPEQQRYLGLARDATQTMTRVLEDLLVDSVSSDGRIELNLEDASLDRVVTDCALRFEAAMQRENLELRLVAPTVRGLFDPARLHQVANNVMAFALDRASPGGTVIAEVFAGMDASGFSVTIPGAAGVSDDVLSKNGLAISRSIVDGHGGHLWLEREGDELRLVVVLPLQDLFDREWARGFQLGSLRELASTTRAPRVLVAVGERGLAYAVKAALLSRGYVVDLALRADEAVQLAREATPEVALVEQDLPDVEGAQLIEILRHDPDTQSVPIIAMGAPEMALRTARAGADAHLSSPVDSGELVANIQRLLSSVREGRRALVVDPDREFRAMCVKTLGGLGVLVAEASDGPSALERAVLLRPELVLTSVELPSGDGFTLFKSLRAEASTERASVIFVSNRNDVEDKVRALRMGGEDYLVKPVEPLELAARAEMVLRRREDEVTASPTTRLPGGSAIEREINRRIESGEPFALCYLDLDNLKAFNDYYGYAKADGVIRQTGDLLRDVIGSHGGSTDFIGHIAGDDFVFITSPKRVDEVCEEVVQGFDRVIPLYYSREDRLRGYIEAEDRYGHLRRFSIMTVSIAVLIEGGGTFRSHASLSAVAAELKKRAKAIPQSCIVRDDVLRSSERTG